MLGRGACRRTPQLTQVVDSTILLNPSFLSKSSAPASAGTFAGLTIHPLDKANLEELVSTENGENGGGPPDDPVEHGCVRGVGSI